MTKFALAILMTLLLSACGIETAGSAATAAALKKQEIEQGKKTLDQVQQQLDQAMRQTQQRAEQQSDPDK